MIKIKDAVDDLIMYKESLKKSAGTIRNLRDLLRFFMSYMENEFHLDEVHLIRLNHLESYQLFLSFQTNNKGELWTPAYINNHLWAIRSLFNYLYKYKVLATDFAEVLEDVEEPEVVPRNVMEMDEFNKFTEQMDKTTDLGYRDFVLYSLLGSSGIRVSECSMLNLSDVNLKERTLFIRKGKGNKQRMAVFGESVAKILKSYIFITMYTNFI